MTDFDLGTDISVLNDLDDNEVLVEDADCLLQDILLRLDTPQGLVDNTEEGRDYGLDLRSYLNAGMTRRAVLELVVAVELQVEQDDRVDRCRGDRSYFSDQEQALYLNLDLETRDGPHQLSIRCTSDTLTLLQV